mgnify:CR=1 FL=1
MIIKSVNKPNGTTAYIYAGKVKKVRKYPQVTEIDLCYRKWDKKANTTEEVTETFPFFGHAKDRLDKLDLTDPEKVVLIEVHWFKKNGMVKPCGDNIWFSGDRYFPDQYMDDECEMHGIHIVKGMLYFNEYETAAGTRSSGSIKIREFTDKTTKETIPEHWMNFIFSNVAPEGKKSQQEIARTLFAKDKPVEAVIVSSDSKKYKDDKGNERVVYNVLSMHAMYSA